MQLVMKENIHKDEGLSLVEIQYDEEVLAMCIVNS